MKRQKQLFNRYLLLFRKYRRKLGRLRASGKNARRQSILELRLDRLWNSLKSLDRTIKKSMVGAAMVGGLMATNSVNAQHSDVGQGSKTLIGGAVTDLENATATTEPFTLATGTPFVGRSGGDVELIDFDNDGNEDLIVCGGGSSSDETQLYKNDHGNFTLVTGTNLPTVTSGEMAIIDFNGDKNQDVMIVGQGLKEFNYEQIAQIYIGDGAGGFSLVSGTPFKSTSGGDVAAVDLDNDGDLDILTTAYENSSGNLLWYKNEGSGNFSTGTVIGSGFYQTEAFEFADMDNDGNLDIVNPKDIFFNEGSGMFTKVEYQPSFSSDHSAILLESLGYDSLRDIIVYGRDNGQPVSMLVNKGNRQFEVLSTSEFKNVYGGDITYLRTSGQVLITGSDPHTGNGEPATNADLYSVNIFDFQGSTDFGPQISRVENTPFPGSGRNSKNVAADFDGDGDDDVFMSQSGQLFINNSMMPTSVMITTTASNPNNLSPIPVSITFGDEVDGFALGDIKVGNGTAENMTTSDSTIFKLDVKPSGDGTVTLDVAAGVITNQNGFKNAVAKQLSFISDRTAPTVMATTDVAVTNKSPFGTMITFSEVISGFSLSDIVVGNGTAANMTTADSTVFVLEITPGTNGTVTIDVAANVVTDKASNPNTAANQLSVTSDRKAPTVTLATTAANPTNSASIPLTVTFSEEINGFSLSDIKTANGTAANMTTSDSTVFVLEITPVADGVVTVDIPADVVKDQVGNSNTAATQLSTTSDRTAPVPSISSSASDPTDTNPIPVKITFTEEINGFSLSDITVNNGSAGNMTTSDSTTFDLEITAAADGAVTADISANVVLDQAGNGNTVASQFSIVYAQPDPFTWTGSTNNDWTMGSNWYGGTVPGRSETPIIPDVVNDPIINTGVNVTIDDLELKAGSGLKVLSGGSLAILGSVSGTGSVTVERKTAGSLGISGIGVPVTQGTVQNLAADVVTVFDETTNAFVNVTTGALEPGKGVQVSFNDPDPKVVFSGTPNAGTITTTLSNKGNKENGMEDGFNLVANPYTAAINRSAFVAANSNVIDGTIWLFANGTIGGDYITVNDLGVSGVSVNSTSKYDLTNDGINSVQGFFVLAQSGADGQSLTFNADMQLDAGNADDSFFRTRGIQEGRDVLKLSLSGQGDQAGIYNEIIVGLDENATVGDDPGLDALKLSGNEFISFYSVQGGKKYAIQALPKDENISTELMLGFSLSQAGTYSMNVDELTSTNEDLKITLMDQVTGETFDLDEEGKMLTFSITEATTAEDRFMLTFPSVVTAIDDASPSPLSIISGGTAGLTISHLPGNKQVGIYDLTGKAVLIKNFNFESGLERINIELNSNQIYVLKIQENAVKFIVK